jgi:hypothetical protein
VGRVHQNVEVDIRVRNYDRRHSDRQRPSTGDPVLAKCSGLFQVTTRYRVLLDSPGSAADDKVRLSGMRSESVWTSTSKQHSEIVAAQYSMGMRAGFQRFSLLMLYSKGWRVSRCNRYTVN